MTTWTYRGTDLSTFGRVTIINDYLSPANKRGNDVTIPLSDGNIHVDKYFDSKSISIGIAVNAASATTLESTYDSMKQLFSYRTQGTLACTLESGSVRYAMASVNTAYGVDRKSYGLSLSVVEFNLADPFFRAGTVIADNTTTIAAGTVAMNVVNPGTAEERYPTITMVGPLNNPVITNTTNNYSISYAGTVAGTLVIQTVNKEPTATNGTANVIGNVTHSGGAALMCLNAGTNVMSITNSGGTTGSVKVSFYAPYL